MLGSNPPNDLNDSRMRPKYRTSIVYFDAEIAVIGLGVNAKQRLSAVFPGGMQLLRSIPGLPAQGFLCLIGDAEYHRGETCLKIFEQHFHALPVDAVHQYGDTNNKQASDRCAGQVDTLLFVNE